MIKVCLNGGRRTTEHPAVPVTPAQLAVAAAASVAAGAGAVHLHARNAQGTESLEADDVGAAVAAVRQACPGVPVGVTTGLWITGRDVGRRLGVVRQWTELAPVARPDFASVNVREPGFAELARTFQAAGIGVEAGVWSVADAEALAASGISGFTRILVEIMDPDTSADAVLARLDGVAGSRLLHGERDQCWPLVSHAARLGLDTRIGLEDTVAGPDGEPVADNAELVRLALRRYDDVRHRVKRET